MFSDPKPKTEEITCDDCGMTLSKFNKSLTFGCNKDFELFNKHGDVSKLLDKIQGSDKHIGKFPETHKEEKSRLECIEILEKKMKAAIDEEDYEKAAMFRDKIRQLRNE